MKALIYPMLLLLLIGCLTIISLVVRLTVIDPLVERRRARAIRDARWETYIALDCPGMVNVGVHLVARWGRHVKILKTEQPMVTVRAEDFSNTDEAEATWNADQRAMTYNRLDVDR